MSPLKSVEETAALLGISRWTVRSYIRLGRLSPVRIGRRVLLEESELERFVREAKGQEAESPADVPREADHQADPTSRGHHVV
jgi:excisionase family DNA binding protein